MLRQVGKEFIPFNPEPMHIIRKARRGLKVEQPQLETMVEISQEVNPLPALREYAVPPIEMQSMTR